MTANAFYPPTQVQLALALAVVKSKPSNTTVKEHVLGLRRQIRAGRRDQAPATEDKHLDSATFWRKAYEESEASHSRLLDRIYELEQRNETLNLAKDKVASASTPREAQPTKRKTRSDEGPKSCFVSGARKQSKVGQRKETGSTKQNGNHEKPELVPGFEGPQDPMSSLMRRFYSLRRLLQKKTDFNALATHSVELCTCAAQLITSTVGRPGLHLGPDLERTLSGIEQCYTCLLQGLKKLSNPQESALDNSGLVTYHMVQLFRTSLEQLHRYTLSKAKRARTARKKTQKAKKKAMDGDSQGEASTPPAETTKVLNAFSQLLATMILSLDPLRAEQGALLEGLLFVILKDVGEVLGLFVFKDLNSDSRLRVAKSKLPLPESMAPLPIHSVEFPAHVLAAEWESKYLIWIVDKAMTFISRHNLPVGADPEGLTSATGEPSPSPRLLALNRTKLQNTLLVGVFGSDDVEFTESLKLPKQPSDSDINSVTAPQDHNPGEWFAQELWRLLGWDVLVRGKTLD